MPKAGTTKKASKAAAKAPRKSSRKGAPAASADAPAELPASKRLQVKWDADRTNRLLDWLDQNPDDRNRLFSDSTAAAKEEGRAKVTAKGAKNRYYVAMAKAVFDCAAEDADTRAWYLMEPGKFATSLTNYVNRLRTQYREFNQKLGRTGAGMEYSDVDVGSEIYNLIDVLLEDFPYWERLHGYWRTLPNFNPLTVTSDPGQDLEDDALDLFQANQPQAASSALLDLVFEDDPPAHPLFLADDSLTPEELAELDADMDADVDAEGDDEKTGNTSDTTIPSVLATPTPAPAKFGASKISNGAAPKSVTTKTKKISPSNHTSAPQSAASKRNPLTAFARDTENDARLAARIRDKKLDRDMGNISVSKAKIDLLSQREAGEIERKRFEHQLIVQREAAENERRREENQVRILQLQLQLQQELPAVGYGGGENNPQHGQLGNVNYGVPAFNRNDNFNNNYNGN